MGFLKDIVDLLVIGREAKKRELEIERLQAEKDDKERLIERASLSDIEKCDPNRKKLLNIASAELRTKERWSSRMAPWPAALLKHFVVLGIIILIIWLAWRVA